MWLLSKCLECDKWRWHILRGQLMHKYFTLKSNKISFKSIAVDVSTVFVSSLLTIGLINREINWLFAVNFFVHRRKLTWNNIDVRANDNWKLIMDIQWRASHEFNMLRPFSSSIVVCFFSFAASNYSIHLPPCVRRKRVHTFVFHSLNVKNCC